MTSGDGIVSSVLRLDSAGKHRNLTEGNSFAGRIDTVARVTVGGRVTSAAGDDSDFNPYRERGLGVSSRIETSRLVDMKAKQGAIVARFLTFFQRKTSLVIELHNESFYRQRPN